MNYSVEQATHDEVNLLRLVRRLEKSVAVEKDWDDAAVTRKQDVWLQALGTLQKVKHGRKLLHNLEQYGPEPSSKKTHQRVDIKTTLDRIELFMTEVQKRTEPTPRKHESILSRIPISVEQPPLSDPADTLSGTQPITESEVIPQSNNDSYAESLRLREVKGGPSESLNEDVRPSPPQQNPAVSGPLLSPLSSLLPATPTPTSFPSSTSTAISTSLSNNALNARRHLQTSKVLHEELSDQLAQMATQLKRNAQHFSESLSKDASVVKDVQEKLESNFTVMLKERIRLRDFRGKSGSTTWLVVGVVVAVLLLFVVMVGVIRFSRR